MRVPTADERGGSVADPRGARRMKGSSLLPLILGGLLALALVGCRDTLYKAQPAFIGAFGGHVQPAEGPALALNVTTTLRATEELRYTFEGEAIFADARYRVEGAETSNGVVSYLSTPAYNPLVATFYDDAGAARYELYLNVRYGQAPVEAFEGSMRELDDGAPSAAVYLQRTR